MPGTRKAMVLIGWFCCACPSGTDKQTAFSVSLPAEIDWVVAIRDGAARGVLRDVRGTHTFTASTSPVRRFVFGFTEGELEGRGIDGAEVWLLEDCGPELPVPTLRLEVDPGQQELKPSSRPVPRLAANICDPLKFEFEAASRPPIACGDFAVEAVGCRASVVSSCAYGFKAATSLRLNGEVCALTESSGDCSPAETKSPAVAAMECDSRGLTATIDLFPAAPPRFSITARKSLLGDRPVHVSLGTDVLRARTWLSDMLLLNDEVVVVDGNGLGMLGCARPDTASRLVFLNMDTLEVVRTATAPPCLARLERDPQGGFFGVFGNEELQIARFDNLGRVRSSSSLSIGPISALADLAVSVSDPPVIAVAVFEDASHGYVRAPSITLVDLNLTSHSTILLRGYPFSEGSTYLYSMTAGLSGRFAIAFNSASNTSIAMLSPTTGAFFPNTFQARTNALGWLADASRPGAPGETWLLLADNALLVEIRDTFGTAMSETAIHASGPTFNTALALAPDLPRMVVAGGATEISPWSPSIGVTGRARLVLIDAEAGVQLPGHLDFAAGPIGKLAFDRQKRLWALLPWPAEVIRLEVN
jgi:hypothetical protein